ncbi:Na+/H+ antiporter NhaC family protein [Campylobacter novaezeelandiae]|uniref:Na+/H+ antiporter NhaC family protein n=1 Tax=Campylobacter novaezeelandiae TaxID=2267891 RepID=UPI00269A8984
MGIGTSFETIPIITTLFVPICLELNFSLALIVFIIGVAGALGDAGSPASETTMGVSVGLNADKQHDHIKINKTFYLLEARRCRNFNAFDQKH